MQETIGMTAGLVWNYLATNGPATTLKLKSALGISNSQLHLALGWLARENKIEITQLKHTCRISLGQ